MAKILIVDDVQNQAMLLAEDLEEQGHDVLGAGSGSEALELATTERPELIFLSVKMSEMDGIETCRRLKADAQLSSIPVILVTAVDDHEKIVNGLNAGASEYLARPFPKEALAVRVQSVLQIRDDRNAITQVNDRLQAEIAERKRVEAAEAELLSKTFMASIQMLVDLLELIYPDCIAVTVRTARIVKDICTDIKMENPWEVDVATMLSQVGCVVVPSEILDKVCEGEELSFSEKRAFLKHPQVAADIVQRIPRMQGVAKILEYHERFFNGDGPPFNDRISQGKEIPLGARILKVALDFDKLVMSGSTNHEAMEIIRAGEGLYDPVVVEVMGERVVREPEYEVRSLGANQLRAGMVLAEHVFSRDKSVLIRNGRTLTRQMLDNLSRYRKVGSFEDRIREPIRVRVPVYRSTEAADAEPDANEPQPQSSAT